MIIGIVTAFAVAFAAVIGACTGAFSSSAWLWVLPVSFLGGFLLGAILAFLFLWVCCAVVRLDVPQKKDSKFYRGLCNAFTELALPVLKIRIHARGLEMLPKEGRFLLVCNHLNDLDPVVLMSQMPKSQLAFISKRENSSMFIVGKLMHKLMCQMVNRENDRKALETIVTCIRIIKDDLVSVAVFPEGYTSMDGLLHPFRSGVFKIAQRADVPIVVCTLQNTQYILKNAAHLKPTDVHVHLLGVIPTEELHGVTAVDIGNRVHAMMAEDLGPDLVLPTEENA